MSGAFRRTELFVVHTPFSHCWESRELAMPGLLASLRFYAGGDAEEEEE